MTDIDIGQGSEVAARTKELWAGLGLRHPQIINKKRILRKSTDATGIKRTRVMGGTGSTIMKRKTALDRVKQFPGEFLIAKSNKLFCAVCIKEIAGKMSVIKDHISSTSHKTRSKDRSAETKKQMTVIAEESILRKAKERGIVANLDGVRDGFHRLEVDEVVRVLRKGER